jgi:hypothetical protein
MFALRIYGKLGLLVKAYPLTAKEGHKECLFLAGHFLAQVYEIYFCNSIAMERLYKNSGSVRENTLRRQNYALI